MCRTWRRLSASIVTTPGPHRAAPSTRRRRRPEIEGLRALAVTLVVALVVVHHVWVGRVSGGVDVFFVLSGFFLTGPAAAVAGRTPPAATGHRPDDGPLDRAAAGHGLGPGRVRAHHGRLAFIPADDPDHPGALSLAEGFEYEGSPDADLVPTATAVGADTTWTAIDTDPGGSCSSSATRLVEYCTAPGTGDAGARVVVAGDSHAAQLTQALVELAADRGYQVVDATRGACPLTLEPEHLAGDRRAYEECLRSNRELLGELTADPPHMVVTVGSRAAENSPAEQVPAGYEAAWDVLSGAGTPVLAVRDDARSRTNPDKCLQRAGDDVRDCDVDAAAAYAPVNPLAAATADRELVRDLDTVPMLCNADGTCSVAVGNVRVYRDHDHLTGTYVRPMAPWFAEALDVTGW